MISRTNRAVAIVFVACSALPPARLYAQLSPWEIFADTESPSVCDVVNAGNAELVVLRATGELVVVTGSDVVLADTFVDVDGFVFLGLDPVGLIRFAEDGDGFRTLWWLSPSGRVVDVDGFTGEPTETGLFPVNFVDVPCDACDFWDDPTACIPAIFDEDRDGVDNVGDLCPNTPIDELADFDGCSCGQLDDDVDGVDNCDDLCPGTPLLDVVDFGGCSCSQFDDDLDGVDNCDDLCPATPSGEYVDADGCLVVRSAPPVTVNICGSAGMLMLALTACGLIGLRRFR